MDEKTILGLLDSLQETVREIGKRQMYLKHKILENSARIENIENKQTRDKKDQWEYISQVTKKIEKLENVRN